MSDGVCLLTAPEYKFPTLAMYREQCGKIILCISGFQADQQSDVPQGMKG